MAARCDSMRPGGWPPPRRVERARAGGLSGSPASVCSAVQEPDVPERGDPDAARRRRGTVVMDEETAEGNAGATGATRRRESAASQRRAADSRRRSRPGPGLLALCALWTWTSAGPVAADGAPPLIVVELFTSQGCSSCPPADRLLGELAEEGDVLALSFHVDYWNRLGWTDPFSAPQWSQRQEEYARRQASDSVYTPQMVIDGRHGFVGSDRAEASRLLERQRRDPRPLELALTAEVAGPSRVDVTVEGTAAGDAERPAAAGADVADLLVLVVERELVTPVRRGENGGRTLRNHRVVRSLTRLPWPGVGEPVSTSVAVDPAWGDDLDVAVVVQHRETLEILAAAHVSPRGSRP
ncbi:MAG: DUF1223 domain-containing protein [Acidobacteria bacterium]|nr:MAG: DUF1223 domain-containing protein [Acidobacteriota bacterium]